MKHIFFSLLFMAFLMPSFAQTLENISKMYDAKDIKGAKTAIDSHMADPKNQAKSESWYYKARIYNALSYEAGVTSEEQVKLKLDAFEAFKKTQELDPKDIRMKLENYKSYLDIYFGLYDLGATFFNNRKFDAAFNSFTKALDVKDFILSRNYTFAEAKLSALDTALVMNSAIAAAQAKKDSVAVSYYRKITDANVSDKNYEEVYEFLVNYYAKNDDEASLSALLEKAKRFYPSNDYWAETEIRMAGKSGNQEAILAKYEDALAKNPNSFTLSYNYAVELYNSIYGRDAKEGDKSAQKAKLTEVLKKAIGLDKGNDATMLMANHLFNAASDYSIEASLVKGTSAADVKKKKDLAIATGKTMDEFIPYGQAAIAYFEKQPKLGPVEKANYKIILGYMSDVYNFKKDTKTAGEYDKKKLAVN